MDDQTRLRVFEPLDCNSFVSATPNSTHLSKLSVQTPTTSSFIRIPYERDQTALENQSGSELLRWKYDQREFMFNSNSTPSKNSNSQTEKYEFPITEKLVKNKNPGCKRRTNQLIGAKPSRPSGLQNVTSKLELLDETHFTSLPIPAPKGTKIDNSAILSDIIDDNSDDIITADDSGILPSKRSFRTPANEIKVHNNGNKRYISYKYSNRYPERESSPSEQMISSGKDTHPIVIVEDYLLSDSERSFTESTRKRKRYNSNSDGLKPKLSLHNLKTKIRSSNTDHLPVKKKVHYLKECSTVDSSTNEENEAGSSKCIKEVLNEFLPPKSNSADCDLYISNLLSKGTNELKRCVICEKILYEVSSLLYKENDFKELVCGSCTEKYETIAKLLEGCELESTFEYSLDSSSFEENTLDSSLIQSSHTVCREVTPPHNSSLQLMRRDSFSEDLIKALQSQLIKNSKQIPENSIFPNKALSWFIDARRKLRWRWRVSGLLPEFTINNNNE